MPSLSIAILCGGSSSRLQTPQKPHTHKALLPSQNPTQTLLHATLHAAREALPNAHPNAIIPLTNSPIHDPLRAHLNTLPFPTQPTLDPPNLQGPLAGLASALHHATLRSSSWLLLLGCDMPNLQPHLLQHLWTIAQNSPHSAVSLQTTHGLQPLHTFYRTHPCTQHLQHTATSSQTRGLRAFLRTLPSIHIHQPTPQTLPQWELSCTNINTHKDYENHHKKNHMA